MWGCGRAGAGAYMHVCIKFCSEKTCTMHKELVNNPCNRLNIMFADHRVTCISILYVQTNLLLKRSSPELIMFPYSKEFRATVSMIHLFFVPQGGVT